MNIEEAIKDIKRIINNPEFDYIVLMDSQGFTEWNDILETLLTAYEKEKEKNKELENADLTTVYLNGVYDGEKKVKDKIKAKIEEVKDGTYDAKIVLQSLLEKE